MQKLGRPTIAVVAALLTAGRTTSAQGDDRVHPSVKHEGTRVWIEGVPSVKLGHLGDDWMLQLRAMQILLAHRGEQMNLDELLVSSGEAFNLCHSDHWELRTYLALPVDPLGETARTYGYDSRWLTGGQFHQMKAQGVDACLTQTRAALEELWSELDAGRPVLVSGIDGHCGNWYVAAGCDRASDQMYYSGGQEPRCGWRPTCSAPGSSRPHPTSV